MSDIQITISGTKTEGKDKIKMIDSLTLYNEAVILQKTNLENKNKLQESVKKSYLQILTTVFHELITKRNSPLISVICMKNRIDFNGENFNIDLDKPRSLSCFESSGDMYYILYGLNTIFSKDLNACEHIFETIKKSIFNNTKFDPRELKSHLKKLDTNLEKFSSKENSAPKIQSESEETLIQNLSNITSNRKADDEKIIDELTKIQVTMQNSLKQISELRDDIDFRNVQEPINQLIQLYYKLDEILKYPPQEDDYEKLVKRCESFLQYIIQSLESLGVEISENPDENKKIGFVYKGKTMN